MQWFTDAMKSVVAAEFGDNVAEVAMRPRSATFRSIHCVERALGNDDACGFA